MTCPTSPVSATAARPNGRGWGLVVLLIVAGLSAAEPLRAQTSPGVSPDSLSLLERYQRARFRLLARQVLSGRRVLRVLPPESIPSHQPSLLVDTSSVDTTTAEAPSSFPLADVRRVRHLERSWFQNRFNDVQWSFLGTSSQLSFLDTTRTRDLRARLQSRFGDPTRTLAEIYSQEWVRTPDSTREEPIQFAYWFVVNDSLPVRVTDVEGPNGRGLIVSTQRSNRDRLPALRAALLQPLREVDRASYVDYVYEKETGHWYRVGFDGQTFFRERISRFDIVPGRRPRLDTVRTAPSAEAGSDPAPSSP